MKFTFFLLTIALLIGFLIFKFYPSRIKKPEPIKKIVEDIQTKTNNILGEEVNPQEEVISQEKISRQIKYFSNQILQQEPVKEIVNKINEVISQQGDKIKDLPKKEIEEVKKQSKKRVCQQICGEWMKEEGD